jgi:hypothetical protein
MHGTKFPVLSKNRVNLVSICPCRHIEKEKQGSWQETHREMITWKIEKATGG